MKNNFRWVGLFVLSLMVIAITMAFVDKPEMGCKRPPQGPQGPTGPAGPAGTSGATGPTGAAGVGGISSFLYNSNTYGLDTVVTSNTPFQFDGVPVIVGTSVTQTDIDTFSLNDAGHYLVEFNAYPPDEGGTSGGAEIRINGVAQTPGPASLPITIPVTLNQIVTVTTVPSTLEVVATAGGYTVNGAPLSNTISIVRLD